MPSGLETGHLTFVLQGEKLEGAFALLRLKRGKGGKEWLLFKMSERER
jgi:hypothetical protein